MAGNIIKGAVQGTDMMTLFSSLVSDAEKQEFTEPVLLAELIKRAFPSTKQKTAEVEGWVLHYAIGFIFSGAYQLLFKSTGQKPTLLKGALLGAASGLIGIGAWKAFFTAHPGPPRLDYSKYYWQLLAAHIVFGIFTVRGLKSKH
jgi:hypothetical protein